MSELVSSLLERHSYSVNYIDSFWLNDLVRLLKQYDIEIKLNNTHLQPIQRENDSFIIKQMLTPSSSLTTIKKLHAYILYLQVTLLSDITSLQRIRANHRTSSYAWPHQQHSNHILGNSGRQCFEQSIALHPVISSNNPFDSGGG